jgi:hypothetical protein
MKPPFWKVIICSRQFSGERVEVIDCFAEEGEARNHAELLRTSDPSLCVRVQRVEDSLLQSARSQAEGSDERVGFLRPIRPGTNRIPGTMRPLAKRTGTPSGERL